MVATEKEDIFIGWKSEDGKLEVIGIAGKTNKGRTIYKVTCDVCSKDKELFPSGYFVSLKYSLENGKKPCGCSGKYQYDCEQYLIRVKREVGNRIIILGYAEEFHGNETRVNCKCPVDNHVWTARINNLLNGKGCPECARNALTKKKKIVDEIALKTCIDICLLENYNPVGFLDGYKNNRSKFTYECPYHGTQGVTYSKFVLKGTRCPACAEYGYSVSKSGSFYVVKWTKEKHSLIKFGITNQKVKARIKTQDSKTEYTPEFLFVANFKDGNIPLNIESHIKSSNLNRNIISKELFADGFTETIETYDLPTLEDLIVESLITINHKEV